MALQTKKPLKPLQPFSVDPLFNKSALGYKAPVAAKPLFSVSRPENIAKPSAVGFSVPSIQASASMKSPEKVLLAQPPVAAKPNVAPAARPQAPVAKPQTSPASFDVKQVDYGFKSPAIETQPAPASQTTPAPTASPAPSQYDELIKKYLALAEPGTSETEAQANLDALSADYAAKRAGIRETAPLTTIRAGQEGALQERAAMLQAPLLQRLAAEQAARTGRADVLKSAIGMLPQPTTPEGFTLGEGQARYDAAGKLIAEGSPSSINKNFAPGTIGEFQFLQTLSPIERKEYKDYQNEDANRALRASAILTGGLTPAQQTAAFKLTDDYEKASGTLPKSISNYNSVLAAANDPSAAGDISLIFAFMKTLDPTSVVREGEFATAQNAGSVSEKVMNMYNKVLSGERLQPSQRADFLNQAKNLYQSAVSQQKQVDETFRGRAKQFGVPESLVIREQSSVMEPMNVSGGDSWANYGNNQTDGWL